MANGWFCRIALAAPKGGSQAKRAPAAAGALSKTNLIGGTVVELLANTDQLKCCSTILHCRPTRLTKPIDDLADRFGLS